MLKILLEKTISIKFTFVNLPISSKYYHRRLPQNIDDAIKIVQKQSKLNQKAYLIQHISDLLAKDRKLYLSMLQKAQINREIQKWKNGSGRFQNIATVAWSIQKMNLQNHHKQLCNQITERIKNDQWYVNFDESVKALQYFSSSNQPVQEKQKQKIFKKIQRNVKLTLWNANMKYYQKICTSLLKAERFKSQLWGHMETQILQNLDMNYDTRVVCDIFQAYALSKNGNDVFYQMMQKVLFRGHFTQLNLLSQSSPKKFDSSGQFFSIVIETYAIARQSCGVILTPDFKEFVFNALIDRKTQFKQLSSLNKTIRSLEGFEFEPQQIEQVEQVLLTTKDNFDFNLEDIAQFYQLMIMRHGDIPTLMHQRIERLLMHEIKRKFIPAVQLVDFTNFLVNNNLLREETKYLETVNQYLEGNLKYLSPQQTQYILTSITQNKLLLPTQRKKLEDKKDKLQQKII